jgi:hypothetical protein
LAPGTGLFFISHRQGNLIPTGAERGGRFEDRANILAAKLRESGIERDEV